jgi:two-component system, chemotaxis family, sensor kinase CheA
MEEKNCKINIEAIKNVLDSISKLIIAYNPGDVLTAAEIASLIKKETAACVGCEEAEKICVHMEALISAGSANNFELLTDEITEGIDLLVSVIEATESISSGKKKQINDWIEKEKSAHAKCTISAEKSTVPVSAPQSPAKEDLPPAADPDQLNLFFTDCEARFSSAQDLILELEQHPENADAVKELFRLFHTIKGECGFLKLPTVGTVAHSIESLLDEIRSGKRSVTKNIVDALLKGLDLSKELIGDLTNQAYDDYRAVPVAEYCRQPNEIVTGSTPTDADQQNCCGGNGRIPHQDGTQLVYQTKKQDSENFIVKVKTEKINYLVDMIGELLIGIGQMNETTAGLPQIRKIARTLQYAGMQLRTESVHALFGTVRRIIRDTSEKVGKPVKTEFVGEDLEIDRTLIESLEEPLMHLVRNSLDHGIETAEERIKAGKTPEGNVRIAAERRGNSIVISVGDDGRGLDRTKILHKAVQKGLIKESDTAGMTDAAVNDIIFISGFSTNDSVNLISGRGVGMDIVKEAVAKAKGHIITESLPGKGTTFSLCFPLSTAIIDGMLTRTGVNIFIIPIASVVESLKVQDTQIHRVAQGVSVLNLRGRMIPVIRIADIFSIANHGQGQIATVVENDKHEQYALINDEIIAKKEVVIKGMGSYFRDLKGISSGTVLSGGSVGFVLDIDQIIEIGKASKQTTVQEAASEK